ncbi:MAG: HAD-IIA family hydrolase [Methanomassiliicoccaceae archaeon]|nr:HAD-IIA family hydrolase [Methanomassiliicoccaceae archaeon]
MRPSGLMIDMDGTVYKGSNVIPGAKEFIDFLIEDGMPFVFLTNNSSHTREYYGRKLTAMGFNVGKERILTSTIATVRFIKERRAGKKVYVIATPEVADEIEGLGIISTEDDPDIVLLTFDRTITFDKINKAYHFLMAGAELIATHPDDLCPTEDAYDVDIGQFIHLLSYLTGNVPTIIGKPSLLMVEMAAGEMGVEKSKTIMIGDRLYTDIKMAAYADIDSVLVLSGEAKTSDLVDLEIKPTYIVGSVADIPDLFSKL